MGLNPEMRTRTTKILKHLGFKEGLDNDEIADDFAWCLAACVHTIAKEVKVQLGATSTNKSAGKTPPKRPGATTGKTKGKGKFDHAETGELNEERAIAIERIEELIKDVGGKDVAYEIARKEDFFYDQVKNSLAQLKRIIAILLKYKRGEVSIAGVIEDGEPVGVEAGGGEEHEVDAPF